MSSIAKKQRASPTTVTASVSAPSAESQVQGHHQINARKCPFPLCPLKTLKKKTITT